MPTTDRIEFDGAELDAAMAWHGGQSSMLYAIASTGALTRGSIRPATGCEACEGFKRECPKCHGHGQPMTDDQWLAYLAGELPSEAERCTAHADDVEEREALESIAEKCRAAIVRRGGK